VDKHIFIIKGLKIQNQIYIYVFISLILTWNTLLSLVISVIIKKKIEL